MKALIEMQKKLYPQLLEKMQQRFKVLQQVQLSQPIGRRGLAEKTSLTERVVRSEMQFLLTHGLIEVTSKGMFLTESGKLVIAELAEFMKEITGLNVLEMKIREILKINYVKIVSGNSDDDSSVKRAMGQSAVQYLLNHLPNHATIAMTGGSTMAAVADSIVPLENVRKLCFVPARGGIGDKTENEANTIVAKMGRKTKSHYRLLHVPDPLGETTYQTLINEPSIIETLQVIKKSNVVIHGIGEALTMARRRKTNQETYDKLVQNYATGEAFGYYFKEDGKIVHKVKTIGIQLEDLQATEQVITVAGGRSKAKAIGSYFQEGRSDALFTDEAAAKEILREFSL